MQGSGNFLSFPGITGFYIFSVSFAVESYYFYREVFGLAVEVERIIEYVSYVGV